MIAAMVLAAGSGQRMGTSVPKQFLHVNEKPLIVYTLEAFQRHPAVDAIMAVSLPDWSAVIQSYATQFGITKLRWIVPGGNTGQESIHNGLAALKDALAPEDAVIIHDGNRCMVSGQLISDSLATFSRHGSAVAAIPCVEAVFRSEDDGVSASAEIPREQLFRTQTPHTYSLGKLLWAHDEAEKRGIRNTIATCTLMRRLGERIYFSQGSEKNIKITTADDLEIFRALLNERDAGRMD